MRAALAVLAVAGLVACVGPTDVDSAGNCVAVLRFEGVRYGTDAPLYQGQYTPGSVVGAVSRRVPCDDTPEPGSPPAVPLQDGESNFLPTGTALNSVDGFPTSERLAARPDTVWIFMRGGVDWD